MREAGHDAKKSGGKGMDAYETTLIFAGAAEPRGAFDVTMDSNDVIETAHAFPNATLVGVHNHGWAHHRKRRRPVGNVASWRWASRRG